MNKVCVLEGSPEIQGNTMQLTAPFLEELRRAGADCREFFLYEKTILPCVGCRACQFAEDNVFGCGRQDDMQEIFEAIMACDLIVLASPVYTWYCTPPMKAALDRLVYGMNKYFGDGERRALAAGKKLALIMTCGYKPEHGSDLLEEGVRRFCRHSGIEFLGALTERNYGYGKVFMDSEKEAHARAFAKECLRADERRNHEDRVDQ